MSAHKFRIQLYRTGKQYGWRMSRSSDIVLGSTELYEQRTGAMDNLASTLGGRLMPGTLGRQELWRWVEREDSVDADNPVMERQIIRITDGNDE